MWVLPSLHRAQSELRLGAVLAAGGLRPGAPRPGKLKTPDFVVTVDTLPFGTEVKRPASDKGILGTIDEAVKQLVEYESRCHLIALDLSDCLPIQVGVLDVRRAEIANEQEFRRLVGIASDYITRREKDRGFDRLAVLFGFADSFLWEGGGTPIPQSAIMLNAEVFHSAAQGLIVDQAQRLRLQLVRGLEAVGTNIRRFERVR